MAGGNQSRPEVIKIFISYVLFVPRIEELNQLCYLFAKQSRLLEKQILNLDSCGQKVVDLLSYSFSTGCFIHF
jgi:hypothetical protein